MGPSKTEQKSRKLDKKSETLIIGGTRSIDNAEVSVIPVFLKSGLKVTKVNKAFKTHGVIMVKNFLPENVILILEELFQNYFLKQPWEQYIIGSQFRTLDVHGHGKLLVENEHTKKIENILQRFWEPFMSIFEGTQNYALSETQILRGPSNVQSVHVDALFSTLNSIIYMKDDCDATRFVNLESYGFTYKDLSTAFDANLAPSDLGTDVDAYGDNFNLEFLKRFYPKDSPVFKKNPICRSSPLAKKGDAIFFDGRIPHFGPECDEFRWVIFRNWMNKDYLKYWSYPVLQWRGDQIMKIMYGDKS